MSKNYYLINKNSKGKKILSSSVASNDLLLNYALFSGEETSESPVLLKQRVVLNYPLPKYETNGFVKKYLRDYSRFNMPFCCHFNCTPQKDVQRNKI